MTGGIVYLKKIHKPDEARQSLFLKTWYSVLYVCSFLLNFVKCCSWNTFFATGLKFPKSGGHVIS